MPRDPKVEPFNPDTLEPELRELWTILQSMSRLDEAQRWRALLYLCDRYIPAEKRVQFRNELRTWDTRTTEE